MCVCVYADMRWHSDSVYMMNVVKTERENLLLKGCFHYTEGENGFK